MRTILVPIDGSDHAAKALDLACDLATLHGGRVALLHVLLHNRSAGELLALPVAETFDADTRAALTEAAAAEPDAINADAVMHNPGGVAKLVPDATLQMVANAVMDQARSQASDRSVEIEPLDIQDGDPARCVLDFAKRDDVDAIVMGSRGVSDIEAMTFGSISHTIFEQAGCTCIAVK